MIEIPAEPADPEKLPPLLKGFKAVPPLITDINLSLDDRFLYISCWGTGELLQYDVSRSIQSEVYRLDAARRHRAPRGASRTRPRRHLNGGPQMVEVSRDGKRIYFTNSLYSPWDAQFYPEAFEAGWCKVSTRSPEAAWRSIRISFSNSASCALHQVRLEGGDASSDSYCYS